MDTQLRYLKGVGPKREAVFAKLGVNDFRDLLYYFPFRYEDRTNLKKIKDLKPKEACLIKGKVAVRSLKNMPYFLRKKIRDIFEIVVTDETGKINCVWFNQGYLADKIKTDMRLIIYGKPSISKGRLQFNSPEVELDDEGGDDSLNLGRIVGIYSLAQNFTQKFVRKAIFDCLDLLKAKTVDPLPFNIRKEKNIPNIVKALNDMHFPACWQEAEQARERFIFEELFFSQIMVYLRKVYHRKQPAIKLKVSQELIEKIKNNLNFNLTPSQERVLCEIFSDVARTFPMHRLLQGDVGCGKTIVAAFSLAVCADSKLQSALMVPTEVLAFQHKETLQALFKGLGFNIEVLVSSLSLQESRKIKEGLKSGEIDIIIGTHALIQEDVIFKKIALAVIDEQHKFGVAQRALLVAKGEVCPHYLVMSATPIPRSLALSIYGDLDLSLIKEMPKNRIPPQTIVKDESKRKEVYESIREKLRQGRQAYIIYPLIEEDQGDFKSVEAMYLKLAKEFSGFKTAKFHGRMKVKEKLEIVEKFKNKKIDILVSTTVVEVGVNVENATVMMVESCEKFGLAQLHQLRGRIQRSSYQPYFILLKKKDPFGESSERIKIISRISDGFKIAEEDLLLRGPGDFFGSSQHGLPALKIANPLRDLEILKSARSLAFEVIKNDPNLITAQNRSIREHLNQVFQYESVKGPA